MNLFGPLVSFDAIDLAEANDALVAWDHKMGAFRRPSFGNTARAHGLRHGGRLVGLTIAEKLIAETVAGISRDDAVELARLCAERRDLCRVVLRLWREFVLPSIRQEWGVTWAISYQHATCHTGNLYRFDGWTPLAKSRSGTDRRSGREAYSKVIWGYRP